MQMFLNKKNLNRISRKSATIIPSSSIDKKPYSTISTFREIKHTKKLLQESRINKPAPTKMQNILSYCRHLSSRSKHYSLMSRPKVNFKEQECKRNTVHDKFYESAREGLMKTTHKSDMMNRTISYAASRQQQRINSLYEQNPIDLQREDFKRRHESLRKYERDSREKVDQISNNTIISNKLGKLPTGEIIQIKQRQQMQKDFLMGLTKFGQVLSNEAGESEQMREFFTALPSGNSIDEKQRSKRLQEQVLVLNQGLDKPVIQKYRKLLDTINDSQLRFPTQSYDQYDKTLSNKNASRKTRKRTSNILLNCAQQWR